MDLNKLIETEIKEMAFEYSTIQKKDITKLAKIVLCEVLKIQNTDIWKLIKKLESQ